MLFKGTDTRSAEDIAQAIDSIGGQLDAFTAKEYASYYIKVLDEHLPLAVDLLVRHRPAAGLRRRTRSSARRRSSSKRSRWSRTRPTISSTSSSRSTSGKGIRSAGRSSGRRRRSSRSPATSLRDYFRGAYVAPNVIISAAGNLEHAQVRELVDAAFGDAAGVGRAARRATPPRVVPQVITRTKELEQSHICLGTNSYPQSHDDRYVSYILNTVLGGSMSSRLFQNVREKRGLAYAVFSGLSAYRDAGNITIYAGCANEAVGEVIDLCVEELRGDEADAGARRGAAAREGSSQGQPDAEPREHRQPHVAPGAAGDLLRPPLRPRRDAAGVERVTAEDVQRVARDLFSNGSLAATVRRTDRRAELPARTSSIWDRETGSTAAHRRTAAIDDSALHAPRDGRDLERAAPLRDLARGRARGDRRDGRGRASCPREAARELRAKARVRRRAHRGDRAGHPARRHRLHDRGGRARRPGGALAALRPHVLRRRRHRAGAADARGLRPDRQGHRRR